MINNCPLCDSQNYWLISFNHSGVAHDAFAEGYHWRLCKQCANAYPSHPPKLSQLQTFWDRNRSEINSDSNAKGVWELRRQQEMLWAKRAYEFVTPFFDDRSGHFLDVACGLGTTVAYFQNNGWVAEGVDADPSTAEHHLRLGITSTVGQIENIKIDKRFDLISIAHALYFISDPLTFVARVKALIKKEGFFLIILSDFLSTLSSGQPGFAHTWYPSSRSMIYVLCQEGFQFVAQQKIRGSMLVLLRNSDSPIVKAPENYPYLSYLKHVTQRFRYNVIGRPILFTASMVRKLRKVSNQSNKAP